jgi:PAP2 superfamily
MTARSWRNGLEEVMSRILRSVPLAVGLVLATLSAEANVITDWDANAIAIAAPAPAGQREMALLHAAMFDAVNSIERRYRPYVTELATAKTTSQEAAAASAAASVLVALHPEATAQVKAALSSTLTPIPESDAKANGIALGEAVASKTLAARANDGANAPDAYRPKTKPGVYVPTAAMVGSAWPLMTPFVLKSPSQFRPPPPIALTSQEWAMDYNELLEFGGKNSAKRSAQQTETARFWLAVGPAVYHQIPRQLVAVKGMSVVESARFMALYAIALTDATMAVYEAKYHYEFWRPLTAIRNGDLDDNPATERDPTWQPIDATPMHPEYPCAHCVQSGAGAAVIEALSGSQQMPEVTMTSTTTPGVTHRWSNMSAFTDEVANARIWAGFHYRFSTRIGTEMGRKIGNYVVETVMQPVAVTSR